MHCVSRLALIICSFSLSFTLIACAGNSYKESTGNYIDDTVITTKAKAALLAEKGINSNAITVNTYKRHIQLSGFVPSSEQVKKAVEVVSTVSGVLTVENDLAVEQ